MQSLHLSFLQILLSHLLLLVATVAQVLDQHESEPAPADEFNRSPHHIMWTIVVSPLLFVPVLERRIERVLLTFFSHFFLVLLVRVVALLVRTACCEVAERVLSVAARVFTTAAGAPSEELLLHALELFGVRLLATTVECVLVASGVSVRRLLVELRLALALVLLIARAVSEARKVTMGVTLVMRSATWETSGACAEHARLFPLLPLVGIGEDPVGVRDLFELLLRPPLCLVRVVLLRQLVVCNFDFLLRCSFFDAQDFPIVDARVKILPERLGKGSTCRNSAVEATWF